MATKKEQAAMDYFNRLATDPEWQAKQKEFLAAAKEAASARVYGTIVADPPWRYKTTMAVTGNAPGRTRQNGRSGTDYPTMGVEEVAGLRVGDLMSADGCHLYLWTTNTHLEHAWHVARSWGFSPKQVLTWCKKPKGMIGFGAFSPCTEFVLFAASGRRSVHHGRCERTWFEWPRSLKHSAKPAAFFDLVEAISPGPYLEMFARERRLGWDAWGNEVPSNIELQNVQ
jgi:N6-adenosine-specific RNA methylase IME4